MLTKERILEKALDLFSENGYFGTNMRSLAVGLGISKSALYKHYKGKEDIWNSMIYYIENYYEDNFGIGSAEFKMPENANELREMSAKQIEFTLNDEKILKIRKLLTLGQYSDKKIAELATKHFNFVIEKLYSSIFSHLIEIGEMKFNDCDMLAFIYCSPITEMIHLCDRQSDRKSEAIIKITSYIEWFINQFFEVK